MTIDPDQRRKWRELADKHVASADLYDPIDESHLVKFARAVPALLDALDAAESVCCDFIDLLGASEDKKKLDAAMHAVALKGDEVRALIDERDSLRAALKLATSGEGAYQHRSEHSRLLASDVAQGRRIAELISERDSLRAQLADANDCVVDQSKDINALLAQLAAATKWADEAVAQRDHACVAVTRACAAAVNDVEQIAAWLERNTTVTQGELTQFRNGAWRKGGGE